MKKQILKFIIALTSANVLFAAPLHSAIDPVPRTDQGWVTRQDAFNKKVLEVGERAEVIFIGDSITQGWEGAGREAWEKHFAKYNSINLGIGGDRTQHVLYRLENGNLKGLKPKAAVVMIGTNNSNGEDNTVEQIADGITAIVQKLRDRLPETKILLIPIFPRGENPNPQRGKINQVNQIIQKLADDRHVLWVDFGHKYLNSDGTIPRDLMPDYLHLSPKAYAIWAESIAEPLALAVGNKVSAAVTDAELSGDWIATMPGPEQEPVDVPFTLKKEGAKLSGSFKGADGRDLPIENGKIDGNQLSWTVKRTRPEGGVMTYRMNGIVEGNRIRGRAATELEGATIAIDWSARRK